MNVNENVTIFIEPVIYESMLDAEEVFPDGLPEEKITAEMVIAEMKKSRSPIKMLQDWNLLHAGVFEIRVSCYDKEVYSEGEWR